ncbi:MAG: PQQ-binding-like beta-propeller repeat protein, partial [Acidobacteria bacterium]|nr:PQQ-binding-like beta-propeller repeat protein [Acidobacteriota bacterium]
MKNAWLLPIVLGLSVAPAPAQTTAELIGDAQTPEDVLTHSMGYDRMSYSPLAQIDRSNIHRLVPVWSASVMNEFGELAAPVVYEGVMYIINGRWTFAIDVDTGRQIWRTPVVLEEGTRRNPYNRGAPVIYEGRLFRITLDNHVVALDMETGGELWKQKFAESSEGYYSTGAPVLAGDVLISGMSGGESTTRGFLDGWDPESGTKLWRRHTIPAPGEPGSETWPTDSDAWQFGGAPTWRSGTYDPELDLVYWGTGNASPWNPEPRGGLDSLYASSVIAVRPRTGEIACHYQYTPNAAYDVDGADEHVLADVRIDGRLRKVMFQANKNGFLYVLDRTDCSLIAAHPFVEVNWATHIDLATGRPVLTDLLERIVAGERVAIWPSRGSNAVPIAFNPDTGLVYTSTWHVPRIVQIEPPQERVIG